MTDRTTLQLSIHRPYGERSLNVAVNLERTLDCPTDMPRPPDPFSGIDNATRVMQRRKNLKAQIMHAAQMLGERLCDLMEDEAGWHGEDRERAIRENLR